MTKMEIIHGPTRAFPQDYLGKFRDVFKAKLLTFSRLSLSFFESKVTITDNSGICINIPDFSGY